MERVIEEMKKWLDRLIHPEKYFSGFGLKDYLKPIPRVDELNLKKGSPVLIRCDLDVKTENGRVKSDARLKSLLKTLNYCIHKGWKLVLFGHIGRDKDLTLKPAAERLSELLDKGIIFIEDWMKETEDGLLKTVKETVEEIQPGEIVMLENTRKYDIERALWHPEETDLEETAEKLLGLSADFGEVFEVLINEAIASSSRDVSSAVIPFGMEKTALGFFLEKEFNNYVTQVRDAELVVFSGLKMDKLDDLLGIVERGQVKYIISAGALAMPLKKAEAELEGEEFSAGGAEKPENQKEKFFVSEERVKKAKKILKTGRDEGVEFYLPVDFVLEDGTVSETIPDGKLQMDVGPETIELFKEVGEEFIRFSENNGQTTAFHNGVFGKFEESEFEKGTREFIKQLKKMQDSGVKVFVGGGEGRKALEKYGDVNWVEHAFTCGGTILTAMTNEPIPYLAAMYMNSSGK